MTRVADEQMDSNPTSSSPSCRVRFVGGVWHNRNQTLSLPLPSVIKVAGERIVYEYHLKSLHSMMGASFKEYWWCMMVDKDALKSGLGGLLT